MTYQMITTIDGLNEILDSVGDGVAALDFETTSLDPKNGKVRLVQICNDDVWAVVDFWAIGRELTGELPDYRDGFWAVAEWFADAAWVVFNAGFEQKWFLDACPDTAITCWDVGYLKRAVEGGGHMTLKQIARDVGEDLDKGQQLSDWTAEPLTAEQLDYAGDDAWVTWRVWKLWRSRADSGHMDAFNLFNDLVLPVDEMQDTGLVLDPERHADLVHEWEELRADRLDTIRQAISEAEVANLNSGKQMSGYFSRIMPDGYLKHWPRTPKTGLLSMQNDDLKTMAALCGGTPVADVLITLTEYKTLSKYLSSFGDSLITRAKLSPDLRIHARYNIAAAITGRFSSSGPNLQQIPKDRDFFGQRLSVRRSFVAPPGRALVSLDYSGIELRVLALLSGDPQLLYDVTHGDVHLETAQLWQGRKLDRSIPEDEGFRSKAKGINFGIIYGIQSPGLSVTMHSTMEAAQGMLDRWAARYPKAFQLRQDTMDEALANDGYIRMVDGGTIQMGKKPSPTRCANYPVQRAALSVMARAIIRHRESLLDFREKGGDARMASTIHDALIDEANDGDAHAVLELMRDDMVQGYLDVFPDAPLERLVEGGIGPSWGELEDVEL
jgi:DNA polymerase-1